MTTLKEFVEANPKLVQMKESKNYPGLFVLKYTRRVFFDALWGVSDYLLDCRGLVVDKDFNVVVQPFTKIFNYKENGAGTKLLDVNQVLVDRKVNGFMAAATLYNGQVLISTTGSLDSDFCEMARQYLGGISPQNMKPGVTYMFEICHPNDPHIIEEKHGAHFLACIPHDTKIPQYKFDEGHSDLVQQAFDFLKPLGIYFDFMYPAVMTFGKVKQLVKECQHEGFIICSFGHGKEETFKIKSPYYLFNKFIARKSTDKLITMMKNIPVLKQTLDEEFYPVVDQLEKYGIIEFAQKSEPERLVILKQIISELNT